MMSEREERGDATAVRTHLARARRWHRARPTGGAALVLLGAAIIGSLPARIALDVNFNAVGLPVLVSLLCACLLVFVALGTLARPDTSSALGAVAMCLSAAALLALFGGFVVGTVLSGVGGLLCYAWTPGEDRARVSE